MGVLCLIYLEIKAHLTSMATTAFLKVLNDVTIVLDSKQCCAAIFIDLAKAFDMVDN